jgi:hypothetical protein
MMKSRSGLPRDLELTCNQICNPYAKPSNLEAMVMCHLISTQVTMRAALHCRPKGSLEKVLVL